MMPNATKYLAQLIVLAALIGSASAFSFDISKSNLNYTVLPPGSSKTLPLTLYLRSENTMICEISIEESMKGWISLNESPVVLQPNTLKTVQITLKVPEDAAQKSYSSTIYFSIVEYSSSGSGMGVDVGLKMPVEVYCDVLKNATNQTYVLKKVKVVGDSNKKKIVVEESNTGSKILALNYYLTLSNDKSGVKHIAYNDSIRPYSSKSTEIDFNADGMQDGEYSLNLVVKSDAVEYATTKLNFNLTVDHTTESTVASSTLPGGATEITSTSLVSEGVSTTARKAIAFVIAVLTLLAMGFVIYLLHKRMSSSR